MRLAEVQFLIFDYKRSKALGPPRYVYLPGHGKHRARNTETSETGGLSVASPRRVVHKTETEGQEPAERSTGARLR